MKRSVSLVCLLALCGLLESFASTACAGGSVVVVMRRRPDPDKVVETTLANGIKEIRTFEPDGTVLKELRQIYSDGSHGRWTFYEDGTTLRAEAFWSHTTQVRTVTKFSQHGQKESVRVYRPDSASVCVYRDDGSRYYQDWIFEPVESIHRRDGDYEPLRPAILESVKELSLENIVTRLIAMNEDGKTIRTVDYDPFGLHARREAGNELSVPVSRELIYDWELSEGYAAAQTAIDVLWIALGIVVINMIWLLCFEAITESLTTNSKVHGRRDSCT